MIVCRPSLLAVVSGVLWVAFAAPPPLQAAPPQSQRRDAQAERDLASWSEQQIAALTDRAQKGDPSAQFDLGMRYFTGNEVTRDFVQAAAWWQKAAAKDNMPAQLNLAVMYQNGIGVAR